MPVVTVDGETVTVDGDEVWIDAGPTPDETDPWQWTDSPLPVYRIGVVEGTDPNPTVLAVIRGRVDFIEPKLNAPGSFGVTFPADALQLSELVDGDGRWVIGDPQIVVWRDGLIVARGFPDEPAEDPIARTVSFLCMDPLEHFARQVIGDAERVNYATTTNWQDELDATSEITDDVTFGPSDEVLRITTDTGPGKVTDVYAMPTSSTFRHTYRAAAWVKLVSGRISIAGRAIYDGGGPGNVVPFGGSFSDDPVGGKWTRWESDGFGVSIDSDVDAVIQINLTPGAEVYVASAAQEGSKVVRISRDDNESVAPGGDVGTLVGTLLQYPITNLNVPVLRKSYEVGHELVDGFAVPHAEHRTVWQAVGEWFHEVNVRYVPWKNRVESGHPDTIGPMRDSLAVGPIAEGGHYGATVRSQFANGQDVTHQAIVHGNASDDVTRDEYANATDWEGPIWQAVVDAPDGSLPPEFPRIAADAVTDGPSPVLTLSLFAPPLGRTPGDWLGRGLWVGERFACRTDLGPKSDSAVRRITRLRLVPPEGDRLEVECA